MSTNELIAFLERLTRSGLLDAAQLDQLNHRLPGGASAEALARALVARGWLNAGQAYDLLAGPPAPPRRTAAWVWVTAAALLATAAAVGLVLLVRQLGAPPAAPGHEQAARDGNPERREPDGAGGKLPGPGDVTPPAPALPEAHDVAPPPAPPVVAVERVEPAEPEAGKKLIVFLKGAGPAEDALRYQFRTDPRGEWRPAPEGRVELPALAPGALTLQVRGLDGRDQPSETVERAWTVAARTPPQAYTVDKTGLVRLQELPPVSTDNKSTLIKKYRKQLTLTASSTWSGWPPENAVDDDVKTSWFSGQDDAAAKGKQPWLQVNFPTDVPVGRVTILGNRDPAWLVGFTILEGRVTLYDKKGKILKTERNKGTGNFRDFDFSFSPPIEGVRAVRFTSLADQGKETVFGDIAIADIQVD